MASFGLKVIRLALSGVAKVSPHAAGRAAFRLFATTPGRRPRTAKEKELLARSDGWMRQAQHVELRFAGGTAVAHRFAARPCETFAGRVLVVHGWGSRAAYLSALTEGLVAAGHEVVALDLPGHGASRGRTLTLPMAVRAIDAAWQRFGGFDYFCGHSFGGEYRELVPGERLRYTDTFDDPNLPGEMQVTVELKKVSCGTEMTIEQAGIPDLIPAEACYLGWQESLRNLAKLVEPDINE